MTAVQRFVRQLRVIAILGASGCSGLLDLEPGRIPGSGCETSNECAPGDACFERTCLTSCRSEQDCTIDATCESGVCIPAGDHCLRGRRRCNGLQPESCSDTGFWIEESEPCSMACAPATGKCWFPPSCINDPGCQNGGVTCCAADAIPGGTFAMPYTVKNEPHEIVVEVKPFAIDRFEVTGSRFYEFLSVYDDSGRPRVGAGAVATIPESGWQAAWTDNPMLTSPTGNSLAAGTSACGRWAGPGETDRPMRCINWFTAQAFCIWDGGRLPTEFEWMFAAMGGDELRPYPWSRAQNDATLDREHACYKDADFPCEKPAPVGSYSAGAARWNTEDLAGNAAEWVLDLYREDLALPLCSDSSDTPEEPGTCYSMKALSDRSIKGGSYLHASRYLTNAPRSSGIDNQRLDVVGFRCVRELQR